MSKFLRRRLSFGSTRSNSSAGSRPPVPEADCKLTLDGNTLSLDKLGNWRLDKSSTGNYENEIRALQEYIKQLEEDRKHLKEKYLNEHGQKLMLEFKNELLTELLAVSQLDASRNNEQFQKEALRVEALKWELGKWALSQG